MKGWMEDSYVPLVYRPVSGWILSLLSVTKVTEGAAVRILLLLIWVFSAGSCGISRLSILGPVQSLLDANSLFQEGRHETAEGRN